MPAGLDVTVPLPTPVLLTVSVKRCSVNIAVTVRVALIVTVQVVPETESHPVHPVKIESGPGVAVSVTGESLVNDAEQALPHVIPAGFDVTLPSPSPCLITASVSSSFTVSVVLPLFP